MLSSITTSSCKHQQLLFVADASKMQPMVDPSFSQRLISACDAAGIPVRGRSSALSKRLAAFDVKASQQAVDKWMKAETMPTLQKCEIIAKILKVPYAYLMTGHTEPAVPKSPLLLGYQHADSESVNSHKQDAEGDDIAVLIDAYMKLSTLDRKYILIDIIGLASKEQAKQEHAIKEGIHEHDRRSPKDRRFGLSFPKSTV